MLLPLGELQALCERLVEREHPEVEPDPTAIVAAYLEAEQLADGRPEDECAALFLALARRSRALGSIANSAIPAAARALAFKSRRVLMREDAELALDRLRVLRRAITWDELRTVFTERLQPIGAPKRILPKRPR